MLNSNAQTKTVLARYIKKVVDIQTDEKIAWQTALYLLRSNRQDLAIK